MQTCLYNLLLLVIHILKKTCTKIFQIFVRTSTKKFIFCNRTYYQNLDWSVRTCISVQYYFTQYLICFVNYVNQKRILLRFLTIIILKFVFIRFYKKFLTKSTHFYTSISWDSSFYLYFKFYKNILNHCLFHMTSFFLRKNLSHLENYIKLHF